MGFTRGIFGGGLPTCHNRHNPSPVGRSISHDCENSARRKVVICLGHRSSPLLEQRPTRANKAEKKRMEVTSKTRGSKGREREGRRRRENRRERKRVQEGLGEDLPERKGKSTGPDAVELCFYDVSCLGLLLEQAAAKTTNTEEGQKNADRAARA